jgi:hypothetical protein
VGRATTVTRTSPEANQDARSLRPKVYATISAVAVLAWGAALLAPRSRFWDDWIVGYATLQNARELGLPWIGYTLTALSSVGVWSFKVVAIGATIVVGCTTYEISGRGLRLSSRERLLLAMLVVALPLNSARTIVILDTYMWSLAVFFVAWWLLVSKSPSSPGAGREVVAAILLFASYTTASLLLFTALPLAHLCYLTIRRDVPWWEGVLRFIARYWYVFLTPIAFWLMRTLYLKPFGVYQSYNTPHFDRGVSDPLTLDALVLSAGLVLVCLVLALWLLAGRSGHERVVRSLSLGALAVLTGAMGGFLLVNRESPSLAALVIPVTLLLCAPVLIWACLFPAGLDHTRGDTSEAELGDPCVTPVLAVGLAALVLALLPYLLVGKLPSFHQWETRHQLLMPLGVGIILVATVRALSKSVSPPLARLVSLGLVATLTFVSLAISVTLVADYRKQAQVIKALAHEPLVAKANLVLFSDEAPDLNYDSRMFQFYEYNGWLTKAFGDPSRLGIDQTSARHFINGNFNRFSANAARYGYGDYRKPARGVVVQVIPVEGASWWTLLLDEPSITLRVTPVDSWKSVVAEGDRLRLIRKPDGI